MGIAHDAENPGVFFPKNKLISFNFNKLIRSYFFLNFSETSVCFRMEPSADHSNHRAKDG